MVHHQLNALGMSIFVEILDVEVGIGSDEVEYVALPHVGPILPTYVPSLYENLVEVIGSGKVDVSLHLLGVSGMASVRFHLGIVGLAKLHRGQS